MDAAAARSAFADALRALTARPDIDTLLPAAGWSRDQYDAVLAGTLFPPQANLTALVGACGGDVPGWERYWRQVAATQGTDPGQAPTTPLTAPPTVAVQSPAVPGSTAQAPTVAVTPQAPVPPTAASTPAGGAMPASAPIAAPGASPTRGAFAFEPLTHEDPQQIGGYKLRARLGAGGMGRVYLSFTPGGRPLALKVVRPEFAADAEFRSRFQQETAAAQRVHGLYTAQVVDFDAQGEQPWLATAFVPGPSLTQAVVAFGPLPTASVRLLMAGVAEALAAIHSAGVVHRDLKPSNVLLAADGPRVIDFGIARAVDATPLTGSGVQIGTPMFMAPEQVLGKSATPATDVHALGSLALYAATRHAPYGDGNAHAVMYRIMNEEPDLTDCPEDLKALIARCLDKSPDKRPTPAEIITTLQDSDGTALKMTDGWLPTAIAAEIAHRTTAKLPDERPDPATVALPAGSGPVPAGGPKPKASWKVRLGLITALVVVAGVGGAWAAISLTKKDDNTSTTGATTPHLTPDGGATTGSAAQTPPPATSSSSPADNGDSASGSPTPGSDPTSIGSIIPGSGYRLGDEIVHQTDNIDIAAGYGLNLTSSPTKTIPDPYSNGVDFSYHHNGSDPEIRYDNQTVLLEKDAQGTFTDCMNDTKYLKDNKIAIAEIPVGARFCVHGDYGRIALVKVTAMPDQAATSDFITVSVIVWQGPRSTNN